MFKYHQKLPWLCFCFTIVLFFFGNSNIFAHEKIIIDHHSTPVIAQTNYDEVEIKAIPVRNNIYLLQGDGGNIGLSVGDDGAMMIDSQFAPLSNKIIKTIDTINEKPIRYLINTHYHFDHTDGNINFANAGTLIIAQKNVPQQMIVDHEYKVLGMKTQASPKEALPKMTFNQDMRLTINDNNIHVFHLPLAHTDGDAVVHFTKQNVIHTGDLFFNGFYPFIDTGVGGSIDGMITAIDRILPLCDQDTLIIPGHGKLGTEDDLVAFQDMLKTVSSRVKKGISDNLPLDDMVKQKILDDLNDQWGNGFLSSEQFLRIAYQGIVNN